MLNTLLLVNEDLILSNATAICHRRTELQEVLPFCIGSSVFGRLFPLCACSAGVLSCVDELNFSTPLAYRCGHNCLIYCEVTLHCNMITWLLDVSG